MLSGRCEMLSGRFEARMLTGFSLHVAEGGTHVKNLGYKYNTPIVFSPDWTIIFPWEIWGVRGVGGQAGSVGLELEHQLVLGRGAEQVLGTQICKRR